MENGKFSLTIYKLKCERERCQVHASLSHNHPNNQHVTRKYGLNCDCDLHIVTRKGRVDYSVWIYRFLTLLYYKLKHQLEFYPLRKLGSVGFVDDEGLFYCERGSNCMYQSIAYWLNLWQNPASYIVECNVGR